MRLGLLMRRQIQRWSLYLTYWLNTAPNASRQAIFGFLLLPVMCSGIHPRTRLFLLQRHQTLHASRPLAGRMAEMNASDLYRKSAIVWCLF